jgi:UDPglucose 6-dehydrogenase
MAFSALARRNGVPALLAEATDQLNRRQAPRLAELVRSSLPAYGTVGILGLSYKPNTGVIEESQGLHLAQCLLSAGTSVIVYDPAAMVNARQHLTGRVTFAGSAAECVRQSDAFVVTTPWAEFGAISPADLKRTDGSVVVLDCWRMLDRSAFMTVSDYRLIGVGADSVWIPDRQASAVAGG